MEGMEKMGALLVLLFGSVANGDFTQNSDADVLVVFPKPVDWLEVYAYSDGLVQPLVKTLDTVINRVNQGDPFMCEIIEDGIPLSDKKDLYPKLQVAVKKAKKRWGLVRTPEGWKWKTKQD